MRKMAAVFACVLYIFFGATALVSAGEPSQKKQLRIGGGAMISPKETFNYYIEMVDYIGEKLGLPATLVMRKTYKEMNDLVERKDVDAAFVCSGPYVYGHDKFGMELLAAPQVSGKSVYYSYIIVHKNSRINKFSQLKGKTFAFTDPDSNSGKLSPTYKLTTMGYTPESYFKSFIYTYSHDNSIKEVARKTVDGAAVDSLIYDYIKAKYPDSDVYSTKVIEKSEGYGIPPFVCHPDLDPGLKARLKEIILNMHKDEKGKRILNGIMIERFVEADDSLYETVRKMLHWKGEK